MGTRILAGRDVANGDRAETLQVALVNEAFVRHYFSNRAGAVGGRFSTSTGEFEVVGVVQDAKWVDLREGPRPMFYRPMLQAGRPGATFAVRTNRPAHDIAQELHREATAAGVSLRDIVPFTEVANRTLASERMLALISGGIGLLGLIMVAVGLYGVMAYTVARRTGELGIRRALGATSTHLTWLVLRESLLVFGIGAVGGIVIVAITAPVASSLLFGLSPLDAPTLAGSVSLLLIVVLLASSGPARRASRVDPLVALRID
jgi:hypothetical protein